MSKEQDKIIWMCQIQYYKNGVEHIPEIDFFYYHSDEGSDERNERLREIFQLLR